MYELKKKDVIREQLKLGDEVLDITLVPDDIAPRYNCVTAQLFKEHKAITSGKRNKPSTTYEAVTQYGVMLTRVMEVLLGTENTKKIVAFYDGHIIEMGAHVTPYLINEIVPKIKAAADDMRPRARKRRKKTYGRGMKKLW